MRIQPDVLLALVETQQEALYHLDPIVWCKEDILDLKCVSKFVSVLQVRQEVCRSCVRKRIKKYSSKLKDEDCFQGFLFPHLLVMTIEKNVAQILLVQRAPENDH